MVVNQIQHLKKKRFRTGSDSEFCHLNRIWLFNTELLFLQAAHADSPGSESAAAYTHRRHLHRAQGTAWHNAQTMVCGGRKKFMKHRAAWKQGALTVQLLLTTDMSPRSTLHADWQETDCSTWRMSHTAEYLIPDFDILEVKRWTYPQNVYLHRYE